MIYASKTNAGENKFHAGCTFLKIVFVNILQYFRCMGGAIKALTNDKVKSIN